MTVDEFRDQAAQEMHELVDVIECDPNVQTLGVQPGAHTAVGVSADGDVMVWLSDQMDPTYFSVDEAIAVAGAMRRAAFRGMEIALQTKRDKE